MITRRQFLRLLAVSPGLGAGVYTWRWKPYWAETVERRLPVSYLPDCLTGTQLVQLIDLRIGPHVDD